MRWFGLDRRRVLVIQTEFEEGDIVDGLVWMLQRLSCPCLSKYTA